MAVEFGFYSEAIAFRDGYGGGRADQAACEASPRDVPGYGFCVGIAVGIAGEDVNNPLAGIGYLEVCVVGEVAVGVG